MYQKAKPHLSTIEIAQLDKLVNENGIHGILRFLGSKTAHEAKDPEQGTAIRSLLFMTAKTILEMDGRFE